jgi:hypothetical protein
VNHFLRIDVRMISVRQAAPYVTALKDRLGRIAAGVAGEYQFGGIRFANVMGVNGVKIFTVKAQRTRREEFGLAVLAASR